MMGLSVASGTQDVCVCVCVRAHAFAHVRVRARLRVCMCVCARALQGRGAPGSVLENGVPLPRRLRQAISVRTGGKPGAPVPAPRGLGGRQRRAPSRCSARRDVLA